MLVYQRVYEVENKKKKRLKPPTRLYKAVAMFNYQKFIHKLLFSQFLVAVDLALLNMHEHTCLRLLVLSSMFDI